MLRPFKILGSAFINMWRNKSTTFFALVSVTASLIILGIVFALILNINSIGMAAKGQFDAVVAFIDEEQDERDISEMVKNILENPYVEDIQYETKEEAMENLKERWGEKAYLLEGFSENPLPRSLIVYVKDIQYSNYVVDVLEDYEGIEDVRSHEDVVQKLLAVTKTIRNAASVLIFILIGVSVILINNAVAMAVASRAKEISIMKFIGAKDWYIRWPFFIEGILIGVMGAGIAYLVVFYGYRYLFAMAQDKFFVIVSSHLVSPFELQADVLYLFMVVGACVGALGAMFSTRKPLRN